MRPRPGALDPERLLLLSRAKLAALVRSHWGVGTFDGDPRPAMSGLVAKRDGQGWMLVAEDPAKALGRGLLWALRSGITELHLLFSASDREAASRAARRGASFRFQVTVWEVSGTGLAPVPVTPLPPEPALDGRAERYRQVLGQAGTEPVVEWGTLFGDVWGLEVARVTGEDSDLWLGVGVTKEDRLTHRLMWGDDPDLDDVRSVVEQVRATREQAHLAHPLNQLARERWLRAWLSRNPTPVGVTRLELVSPPVPRPEDVRVRMPAFARGSGPDGDPVLVACSVGFDSEVVPMLVERGGSSDERLVLALPGRDDHQLLRLAVGAATRPVEVATVPDDWPERHRRAVQLT